ncbi:MAG: endonuclease/exonuclease/phosphatase family protein [Puia sp.]|nr:endonuclease/exonuclease/phosphatase family protein [Puia sp.]
MATLKKFTRRFLLVSNIIVVILFFAACANAFLSPAKWWLISLLGLLFPLLLLLVLVFFVGWMFSPARRWALLSLAALVLGWKNIHSFLAFNAGAGFSTEKPDHSLRVLTWNVRRWDEFIPKKEGGGVHRRKMMEFLAAQKADVMCFQEFFESHMPKEYAGNIGYIRDSLHYPYYYFSEDYRRYDGAFETGVIIFSRYPILQTFRTRYNHLDTVRAAESLIAADISIGKQTIRLFTTHLQSVLFHSKDYHNLAIIRNGDDSLLQASRSIVKKLRRAYSIRGDQADTVRARLDLSSFPAIVCGDFNDVPNSYTYFRIRGDRQDAFIQKGFGIGRTFAHISPTLRIDYIFADPVFKVLQCRRFTLPYSDHHPVIADLQLP